MNTKSVKDYYAVLGVSQDATLEEIRLAYRKKARAFHPDLSSDPDAEERFREVNEAYGVLADSEKRRSYDYFITGAGEDEGPHEADVEPASRSRPVPQRASAEPSSATPPPPESDAQTVTTSPPADEGTQEKRQRLYPPTWAVLLIVLGACIILGVAVGGVLSLQRNRPTGGAQSVDVTKLTTFISPPTLPPDLTVIQEDNTPLPTMGPVLLTLPGTSYPVVAVTPEQGRWPLPAGQEELGLWMHGTLINYVIGLPYAATTESLLSGLVSSDRITLTLENGARLVFGSPQTRRVDAGDASPLAQNKPGLTLLLLGGDQPSRLVVKARYLPEDTRPPREQEAEGLLVELLTADTIEGASPPQANSWYFVVDYQVENPTAVTVDPSFFDLILEDSNEQRFVYSEAAAELGTYGPLTNEIAPGTVVTASAGYVVPQDFSEPLIWTFRADVTSPERARFILNFQPPAPGPAQPEVEIYDVFLDEPRDAIVVSGTVYNDGEQPLTVGQEDVSLAAGTGQSRLLASSPPLPWSVEAGGFQDFEVQFSVPAGSDTALVNILGWAFEIEGLRP